MLLFRYIAFRPLPGLAFFTLCLWLCGAGFGFAAQSGAPTAAPADAPASADPLARIWATRLGDVALIADEAVLLSRRGQAMAKPLADKLQNARARFSKLGSLYEASKGHPTEQMTLVQQMHALVRELRDAIEPLRTIATTLAVRLDEVGAMQKSFKDAAAEGANAEPDSAESLALSEYGRALENARRALAPAAQRVEAMLIPAQATFARINDAAAAVESSLLGVWEKYYLTPSDNTLDALASTPSLLSDWVSSLSSRMGFAYPQTPDAWGYAFTRFFITAVCMAVAGFFVLRGASMLPDRWRIAFERVIKGSWGWVGFGFSLLVASSNRSGGVHFALALVGSLIVIGGVAVLSWRLRMVVLPERESRPSSLMRLYPPAAVGVFMLFSDLPARVLGIVWGLVMLAFVVRIFFANRQYRPGSAFPLPERLSHGCAFWLGIASLLVAAAGYARMAILLFMVLFALVNTIILASALIVLFTLFADSVFSKTTRPVYNAVAQAVAIPVSLVLSLLCTVPWIWAVPGARYLIEHFLSTGYTVGEASFNFSKLILIVLLFFLFRSFVSLAKAFMDHLPDRLPSMERGVLPPLRTLVSYGLWAVFCMVALGMLGVNLTSLAVVAGGLSVGIGFGLQTIFNNLISGLMLIFGKTILVGDYVDVAGASGTVRAINIRSTTIETPDRALVYVPNSSIMAGQVANWTRNSRIVRCSLNIGVPYGSDTALVTALLLEAAGEQDHVLQFPAARVLFADFGEKALGFRLNVFVDDFDNSSSTMSDLRYAVEKKFREHSIDIPFPRLTVHMPTDRAADESVKVVQDAPRPDQAKA